MCLSAVLASLTFTQKVAFRNEIISNLKTRLLNHKTVTIYVVVALCDNEHQGIVKVSNRLGNGEDLVHNLYWGASFGVKTFFESSDDWQHIKTFLNPNTNILERCVFKRRNRNVFLIADAFRGSKIKDAIVTCLKAAAGDDFNEIQITSGGQVLDIEIDESLLIAYIGHNGLMDFELDESPQGDSSSFPKDVMILACASKFFFDDILKEYNVFPLVWTKGLLAPEAYILEEAVEGWLNLEDQEQIRIRAAAAYSKYQKCSLKAAKAIFATGW
jgi:hypothetical protein